MTQLDGRADHGGVEHPQRLDEQLLAGLVAVEHSSRAGSANQRLVPGPGRPAGLGASQTLRAPTGRHDRRLDAARPGTMLTVQVGYTPVDDDLYREIILDHYRNPRHRGAVDHADGSLEADNPLCGDEIHLSWRLDGDRLAEIAFTGRGCSISQAAASMLCDQVAGLPREQALEPRPPLPADAGGGRGSERAGRPGGAPGGAGLPDADQVRDPRLRRSCGLWTPPRKEMRHDDDEVGAAGPPRGDGAVPGGARSCAPRRR